VLTSRPIVKEGPDVSEDEPFKVTDRRSRGESPPGPVRQSSESSPAGEAAARPRGAPAEGGLGPDPGSSELGGLFMMFASSALISLGAAPDPQTNEPKVDLAQAQAAIDVLLMLREKTQGNRTAQETRLLESIIYDLQMRFVRTARGNPPV
jgi:hypothetical protein